MVQAIIPSYLGNHILCRQIKELINFFRIFLLRIK